MRLPEAECSCSRCQNMCREVPCHGTPKEMQAIIDAGYSDRLWIYDQWDVQAVFIRSRDEYPHIHGVCPFLTKQGLCELHDKGLKPIEGRVAIHKDGPNYDLVADKVNVRKGLARSWAKPLGQAIVKQCRAAGMKDWRQLQDEYWKAWWEGKNAESLVKEFNRTIIL